MRFRYISWQWFFVFGIMFISIVALGVIAYGAQQAQNLLEAEVNKHNRTLSFYIPGELNSKISSWLDGTHQKFLSKIENEKNFLKIGEELLQDQSISGFFYIDLDSMHVTLIESNRLRRFKLDGASQKKSQSKMKIVLNEFIKAYFSKSIDEHKETPILSTNLQVLSGHSYQSYHGKNWRNLYVSAITQNNLKVGLIGIILDWNFLRRLLTVLVEKYPNVTTQVEGWGNPMLISYSGLRDVNEIKLNLESLSSIGPFPLSKHIENVKVKVYYPSEWDLLGGPAFNSRYTQYFIERTRNMYKLIIAPLTLLLVGLISLYINLRNSAQKIRIQNDWIQNIAHDIQTPIHAMGSVLDLLQESESSENAQWNKFLRLELSRLHQTSRVFMQLARDDRAARNLHRKSFIISLLFERSIHWAELVHMGKSPKINWNKEQANFKITADFDWLLDAMINLLDNACKYSPGNPEIELYCVENSSDFEINVADQGYGIPENAYIEVFRPFYRAYSSQTEGIHGNGLGLSIVDRITKAHGGSVSIQSNSPKGICVCIRLPKNISE